MLLLYLFLALLTLPTTTQELLQYRLNFNNEVLTIDFSPDDDLESKAFYFVKQNDIRAGGGCVTQACTVALIVRELENLIVRDPATRFPPQVLAELERLRIDPRDVPRSTCELMAWEGIPPNPIRAAQKDLLCKKYPDVKCDNFLSDLCQMSLMAKDPDEEIQVDIGLFSEADYSIMKMKQQKYFNNSKILEVNLKRRDINDWIDRSFGRIICMIPARAGSERLKLKNLRLIAGKPMIQYAIETAKNSEVCDRVVVNSDSQVFAEIAEANDVEFYLRPKFLGSSETKADDVVYNFMSNYPGDLLVWVNPTSPLQSVEEVREVVQHILKNPSIDTLITVNNYQRHAVMKKSPLNFNPEAKGDKTQDLAPVSICVYSILAWQYKPFKQSYEENGGWAYFNGKVEYFEVSKLSGIAIKYEEDLLMAESILLQQGKGLPPPEGGHPDYHALASQVFEATEPADNFDDTAVEDRPLVVVLSTWVAAEGESTWVGEERDLTIINNVNRIFKYHPDASVHVIDNGSLNKEHLAYLRLLPEYANAALTIDELATSGFELGAYSFAFKKYSTKHTENSNWLLMQDAMELQGEFPLSILNHQEILPFFYFTYPLVNEKFCDERISSWVEGEMKKLGFKNPVRSAVFANSFATTSEFMRKLSSVGVLDIVVDEKYKSQGCERLLGGIFAGLGYEPYVYALASKGMTVSKGRNFDRKGLYVRKLESTIKAGFKDSSISADYVEL
ncbi:hypothetical protein TrVE_jg6121 [Triparma verrucosa]|uniref:Uncharacterized protein n=1 Tax=Triparma verrucosa TaxID=1606542 RepID=A0A9W7BNM6_9STRA|nr:hypothetical protein TrVE_jg6121 [Triparma verrucosa]